MVPMSERRELYIRRGSVFDEMIDELVNLTVAKHDDMADALADIYQFSHKPRSMQTHRKREAPNSQFLMKNLLAGLNNGHEPGKSARRVF